MEKLVPVNKTKLESDAIKWLNASQEGSKEEYEEQQKELQSLPVLDICYFSITEQISLVFTLFIPLVN